MLDFVIDNIFILFDGLVFQQTIGIPMDTNCGLLLANMFLHACETDFFHRPLKILPRSLIPIPAIYMMFCH